ncbi:MAG: beta galactosidase jelly roll domain-containing protein [Bacteroidales bacterium]|nr:beta galactosidase jelly roll domain-containing protein [Bacteroidales bacterium]
MNIRITALLATALAFSGLVSAQNWAPAGDHIRTKWAEEVTPANVHQEYPRPQLVRGNWLNLNGLWDYAIVGKEATRPTKADGKILVPFCVESSLSGVGRTFTPDDALWYRTSFRLPAGWKGKKVRLNFEAVDWSAQVWVNGKEIGSHTGGYTHFSFDITPALNKGGNQELVIKVLDGTDNDIQPRGKQVSNPSGIWYTAVSGIWQTVWLEAVPDAFVADYNVASDIAEGSVTLDVDVCGAKPGDRVKVAVIDGGVGYDPEKGAGPVVADAQAAAGEPVKVVIPDVKLWSPDSPYLYGLKITLERGGKAVDEILGYTALRKISAQKDKSGRKRMAVNDNLLFQFGPLDQGWWPDGLYTAPTDEALEFDVIKTRDFGFNMIRKHIKVEPSRWYYFCDKHGVLVWQDMPSFCAHNGARWDTQTYNRGEDVRASRAARTNYYKEWGEIIAQLNKFQCIAVWVPFNEAWAQFNTAAAVDFTREKDPTRLINMASGGNWYTRRREKGMTRQDTKIGDIIDCHNYPEPWMSFWDFQMVNVLGEYGGIGLPLEGHLWQTDRNWGYVQYKDGDEVLTEYTNFAGLLKELVGFGCSAAVYTQTTDVEGEVNGLMTYDRKVIKMNEAKLRAVNLDVIASMEE